MTRAHMLWKDEGTRTPGRQRLAPLHRHAPDSYIHFPRRYLTKATSGRFPLFNEIPGIHSPEEAYVPPEHSCVRGEEVDLPGREVSRRSECHLLALTPRLLQKQ